MAYQRSSSPKGTVKLVRAGKAPEYKFPVKTLGQAHAAMSRLNQAKPALPPAMKKHVARRAKAKLGHSTEAIKRILGS
jgi:hypothetical protein